MYHDVLQLVVWVGYVGRRQDQQPPLFVELIQESRGSLHIKLHLHLCKYKKERSADLNIEVVRPCFMTYLLDVVYLKVLYWDSWSSGFILKSYLLFVHLE